MRLSFEALASFALGLLAGERLPSPGAGVAILLAWLGAMVASRGAARRRQPHPANPGGTPFLRVGTILGLVAAGWWRASVGGVPADMTAPLDPLLEPLRAWIDGAASRHLDGNALSLYRGMVLGQRERFDPALLEAMKRAGTTHLLAVSGLNVAVLVVALDALLRLARVPPRAASAAIIPAIFAYAFLVGGDPPVLRAAVMGSFLVGGRLAGRRVRGWDSLAISALVLLWCHPSFLHDVGFHLSFTAVAALIAASPLLRAAPAGGGPRPFRRRIAGALRGAMGTTLAAQAGVFPLILALDGRLSLVAPLANLLAVPPSGLVVPVGLALPLADAIAGPLGAAVAGAAWALARMVEVASMRAAELPAAAITLGAPHVVVTLAYYAGWTLALPARGERGRGPQAGSRLRPDPGRVGAWVRRWGGARAAGFMIVAGSTVLMLAPPNGLAGWWPRAPGMEVTFLDVGQGDACVIRSTRGTTVLVDAGPAGPRWDAGFARVLPWLRRHRVTAIDLAVLTHPHDDHAGGFPAVLGEVRVASVVDPGEAARSARYLEVLAACARRGVRYRIPEEGEVLLDDGVIRVTVVHSRARAGVPSRHLPDDLNGSSIGLRVESPAGDVVLLGDLGRAGQEMSSIIPAARDRPAPCLAFAMPHHGSRDAVSPRVLDALAPRWVVISAGRHNRFGFPHPETLHALAARRIAPWITGRDGDVTVVVSGDRARLRHGRAPAGARASGARIAR